nr:reverse transcriptase domain-containing protein [Tanacetum cinerariifolium]
EDDSKLGVILGRSLLRLAHGVVDFGNGVIIIYPEPNPFEDDSEKTGKSLDDWDQLLAFNFDNLPKFVKELPLFIYKIRKSNCNKKRIMENLNIFYQDIGPSSLDGSHLTQEEAEKEALAILDEIWKDKVELDGKTVKEEEDVVKRFKGEALKEKDNPGAFIFPIRTVESDSDDEEEYVVKRNRCCQTRNCRKITEMEHRARGVRHTLHAKSITQRKNIVSLHNDSGAGLILTNPEGIKFTYALRFEFNTTNNKAEYEARIAGLRIAEQMGIKNLQTNVDSRLATNRVNESYIAKEPGMIQYMEKVKTLTNSFKKFSIKKMPMSKNKKADALICRFGLLWEIISDNGKQFRENPFKDWCEKLNICQRFASVKHPQTNGLVERANKSLREGIKVRLDKGSKDLILAEIGMPTLRTTRIDMIQNDEALKLNLDLLEEKREQAAICEAKLKIL